MNTNDFWPTFVGGLTPLEFMYRYRTEEASEAVRQYLATYPRFYGIVLQGTWHETFTSAEQYNREEVAWALTTYLEDCRAEWAPQLRRILEEERAKHEAAQEVKAKPELPADATSEEGIEASTELAEEDPGNDAVTDRPTEKADETKSEEEA